MIDQISVENLATDSPYSPKRLIFVVANLSHRGHGDDGPPVGVEHRLEGGLLVLLLKDVDEGGEHDGAHAEEEEEEAELLVVGPHCVAEGLQPRRMTGQLEDPSEKSVNFDIFWP